MSLRIETSYGQSCRLFGCKSRLDCKKSVHACHVPQFTATDLPGVIYATSVSV